MARRSLLPTLVAVLALIASFVTAASAQGTPNSMEEVPEHLVPPGSSVLLFTLGASGVQIYACEADPNDAAAFVWTFTAPEAGLYNAHGERVGTHYAGPTWQGPDGSTVTGAVVERADAAEPGAIPWLLLAAEEHGGSGAFSTVTYIQRLDTVGGIAPAEGCDEAHEGETVRVPYDATYAFFYPVAQAATPAA